MPESSRFRLRGAAALLVGGVLLIAGCGSSTGGASAAGGSGTAGPTISSTASTSSSESDGTAATSPAASGGSAGSLGFLRGALDASRLVTTMQGTISVQAGDGASEKQVLNGTFSGRQAGNRVDAMSVDMTVHAKSDQDLTLKLLSVDGTGYIGGDQLLQQLKVDKPWLELSPDSPNQQVAALATQLDSIREGVGPEQIEKLQEGAVSATEIGPEDVDGVATTRYQVVIDVKKSLEALGSAAPSIPASADVPDTIPTDLWLDDRGRMIKTQVEQQVQGQRVLTTVQITSYDEPVDIAAPDPSEVSTG